jgi:Tfp pilus assembly protein PilX
MFKIKNEEGVILWITMVILLVMMVMAVGFVRTTETAVSTSGNLAFKQSTVSSAERGIQTGRQWITDKIAGTDALGCSGLDIACAAAGYTPFVTTPATGQTWEDFWNANVAQTRNLGVDESGNTVRIWIQRMCSTTGVWNDPGNNCVTQLDSATNGTSSKGSGRVALTGTTKIHYSILVRVDGPKNSKSMVQSIIQADV